MKVDITIESVMSPWSNYCISIKTSVKLISVIHLHQIMGVLSTSHEKRTEINFSSENQ